MSVLQEILDWSQTLPDWQSDAIARLLTKPSLSQSDLDDLYAMLKADHGIVDPRGRSAKRLNADHIPAVPSSTSHVELLAIKDLRYVNAIAENQRLPFGPKGLTVIYGDNGSGKSGYSRVLKRACRARDQAEPIHPKATLPAGSIGTAQATFELSVDGIPQSEVWFDGEPGPKELSTFAIFDSRCARAYLDDEDDFAYVPYGLEILRGLADACNQLDALVRADLQRNVPDTTSFDDLSEGETKVSTLIEELSAKTRLDKVDSLSNLNAKEIARRDLLQQNLAATDPLANAAQLRLLSSRIAKLARIVDEKTQTVGDLAVSRLRDLDSERRLAREAARLAAQAFQADATLLPGTCGEAWKRMFDAARRFYSDAIPNVEVADLDPHMQCPLCQQPLGEGAHRLKRLEEFVENETEKKAGVREREFDHEYRQFSSQSVALGFDNELQIEIEDKEPGLAVATKDFEKTLEIRFEAIKTACVSQEWSGIGTPLESPAARLQALADSLTGEAADLETAADVQARATMQIEFNELDARSRLARVKSSVIAAIEKHAVSACLSKCLKAVKTTAISKKASELAAVAISMELEEALNKEFKLLGAETLSVALQSRSSRGKTLHKLKLGFAQAKKPGEVLSEGEQRAVAIASFLAEANLGGGKGGVVFDDPVSSLDHKRRERVAVRLVQEALKRQVIVFTHDVYFLSLMVDEAARIGAVCLTQSLTRRPEGYGVADPRLPFEVMGTRARVGELRNLQQKIDKLFKSGDEPEHRAQTAEAYRHLRMAWERAVEEVLFRNVVIRFRKGISTQPLIEVAVEDSDYILIESQMSKCSNYAHDQALLGGTAVPDPDELLKDIETLDSWRMQVEKRLDVLRKRRKASATKQG